MHDWQDAFDLAREEGVLTWEYQSRDQFLNLQDDIKNAGWVVEKVEEGRRSGGLFSRSKILVATLRLREKGRPGVAAQQVWSSPELLRSREHEVYENGNGSGNGHSDAHESGNGSFTPRKTLPPVADDRYEFYPEVDDSAVNFAD